MLKDLVSKVLGRDSVVAEPVQQSPNVISRPTPRAAKVTLPKRQTQKDSDVGPASPNRVPAKSKEASPELVTKLLSFSGQVLSVPGGVAELTASQQKYVALLGGINEGSNTLVVSKDYALHYETSSARQLLRKKGLTWNREFHVDLEVIRKIYEKAQQSSSSIAAFRGDTATMQREFIGLLHKAASVKASDIHLVVQRYEAVVKIRADGVMAKLQDLTSGTALELCQAAFAMADASDPTYMPMEYQGARVTEQSLKGLKFPEGVQSVRLQFNPLPAGGRYMIARLLYSQKVGSNEDVDGLGYAPNQIAQIRDMRRKPYGINIISGPTGSGKSTTLQRGLTALMRERSGINVVTIEDPPEYIIEGAAQLPVTNAKTAEERSEKFRQAITAALRSDPDVIMIGEIRDHASAHLAFEAAMTGHGVWASLHANDAISILDRLRDQGVETYKLGDGSLVTGLIGQRLARKVKPEFAVDFDEGVKLGFINTSTANLIRDLAGDRVEGIRFAGTHHVFEDGDTSRAYSGRSVVAEVVCPDQKFLDLVKEDRKPEAVKHWLENLNGMTMLEHGFVLMCTGKLDPRELEEKVGLVSDIDPERIDTVFRIVLGD